MLSSFPAASQARWTSLILIHPCQRRKMGGLDTGAEKKVRSSTPAACDAAKEQGRLMHLFGFPPVPGGGRDTKVTSPEKAASTSPSGEPSRRSSAGTHQGPGEKGPCDGKARTGGTTMRTYPSTHRQPATHPLSLLPPTSAFFLPPRALLRARERGSVHGGGGDGRTHQAKVSLVSPAASRRPLALTASYSWRISMTQKYSTHSLGRRERVTLPASHVVEREVRGHGRELAARALRRERGRLPREPVHLEQRPVCCSCSSLSAGAPALPLARKSVPPPGGAPQRAGIASRASRGCDDKEREPTPLK